MSGNIFNPQRFLNISGNQCRPRSKATKVKSDQSLTLFALITGELVDSRNKIYLTPLKLVWTFPESQSEDFTHHQWLNPIAFRKAKFAILAFLSVVRLIYQNSAS